MKDTKITFFNIFLYVIYGLSIIYFGLQGEIGKIAMTVISAFILFVLNKLYKHGFYVLDKSLFIVSNLFILCSFVLGSGYDFYGTFKYYDDLLHFSSGFIAVKIGFNIIEFLNIDTMLNKLMFFSVLFFFSMGFASICEIYEYIFDKLFDANTQPGGLDDTMMDMIDSLVGVLIMISYYYVKLTFPKNTHSK